MGITELNDARETLASALGSAESVLVADKVGGGELRELFNELVDPDLEGRTSASAVDLQYDDPTNIEPRARFHAVKALIQEHLTAIPSEVSDEELAITASVVSNEMVDSLEWAREIAEIVAEDASNHSIREDRQGDPEAVFHDISHMIQRNKLYTTNPVSPRADGGEGPTEDEWLVNIVAQTSPSRDAEREADNDLICSDKVVVDAVSEFRKGVWELLQDEDVDETVIERLTRIGGNADVEVDTEVPPEAARARGLLVGIVVWSRLACAIGDIETASAGNPPQTAAEWETLLYCAALHVILQWRYELRTIDPIVDDAALETIEGRFGPNPRKD